MKNIFYLFFLYGSLLAQNLEIEGTAKIIVMNKNNSVDSVVVRLPDGTLALRDVSSLYETQILSILNDTIFLSNGSFVKLPFDGHWNNLTGIPPEVGHQRYTDAEVISAATNAGFLTSEEDGDVTNEKINTLAIVGDSLSISEGAMTMKVPVDSSNTNELQLLSAKGDSIFIEGGNFIIISGLQYLNNLFFDVQQRLDDGETPFGIISTGIPGDSLYGKTYQGGLIFYLDLLDTLPDLEGMVAAPLDQDLSSWGPCSFEDEKDLPNVPNVTTVPPTGAGANIGHGRTNTDSIIVNNCITVNDAARVCSDLTLNTYDDWFLPSILELKRAYTTLHLGGIGVFNNSDYWSSTELSEVAAWAQRFSDGLQVPVSKSDFKSVRAVRIF